MGKSLGMRHEAVFVKHALNVPMRENKRREECSSVPFTDLHFVRAQHDYAIAKIKRVVAPRAAAVELCGML